VSATSANQLLTPAVLAGLANLDLVARTAVEGFLVGLHRSPRFGFSQEFAEYRAYAEGDDPRFVDWNVFARTERTYVRRYQGETNTRLMVVLDASASMTYRSTGVSKLQYGKFLAAALSYLAMRQHDPVGLIVFDTEIRHYRPPSSRAGALQGVLHALDTVTAGKRGDLETGFGTFREHLTRRGLVAVISDLYCDPAVMRRAVQPLAYRGHDIMFFQIMDRTELSPNWKEAQLLEDMESGHTMQVSAQSIEQYGVRLQAHLAALRQAAAGVGADQVLIATDEPLDRALKQYLLFRQGRD
jgi:uncharacterized protein (DUF58 family)